MKVLRTLAIAAAAGTSLVAGAAPVVFSFGLAGSAEDPPVASPGTGTATITFDDSLRTMRIEADFSGLVGTTTAAHVHCCTALPGGGNAGVASQTPSFAGFPLGMQSGSYDMLFDMTDASSYNTAFITANGGSPDTAFDALLSGAAQGRAYLNLHSTFSPSGEIRGFLPALQQVPEPASIALALSALLLLRAGIGKR